MQRERYQKLAHFDLWRAMSAGPSWKDRFCSSPYWGVPLCSAFQSDSELMCYRSHDTQGLAIFAEKLVPGGMLIVPADGMWLLGTPLLADDPTELLRRLLLFWRSFPVENGIRQVLISGLYPENPLANTKVWHSLNAWELEVSGRMVASLVDGVDGFMGRRSKNFRSRLRRTVKAAKQNGVSVEFFLNRASPAECETILGRIFKLEEQSWKGLAQRGIDQGGMRSFYEQMVPLLAGDGALRGLFLRRDGKDIAYLLGAFFDGYFRGLQFSYLADEALGLGNVCQYHMICKLVEEGCLHYDLGQAMDYKKRWAENHIYSRSFVFQV